MLLDAVNKFLVSEGLTPKSNCPYCGGSNVIRYGYKWESNGFSVKIVTRLLWQPPISLYRSLILRRVYGRILSAIPSMVMVMVMVMTCKRLGINHQMVFNMHHMILLALQSLPGVKDILLGDRKPRKHGVKAEKSGISNEYVCICTGIEWNGAVYAVTINRAKLDANKLARLFENHISQGTLVLCDGLKNYNILPTTA